MTCTAELTSGVPDEAALPKETMPAPGGEGLGMDPPDRGGVTSPSAPSPSEQWERAPVSVMNQVGWSRPWYHEQWVEAMAVQRRLMGVCQVGFWCLSLGVVALFVLMVSLRLAGGVDDQGMRWLAAAGLACGILGMSMARPWLVLSNRHHRLQAAWVTQEHVESWEQSPRALDYLHRLDSTTVPLLVGDVHRLIECYNEDVLHGAMRSREVVPTVEPADTVEVVEPEVALAQAA